MNDFERPHAIYSTGTKIIKATVGKKQHQFWNLVQLV